MWTHSIVINNVLRDCEGNGRIKRIREMRVKGGKVLVILSAVVRISLIYKKSIPGRRIFQCKSP